MEITITGKEGATLHTANKYCKEDVSVKLQTEELNLTIEKETQVKEGLFNKVTVEGMKITNTQYLFYGGARLELLDLFLNLCSNVNNTSYMFNSCSSLTKLDLSKLNTRGLYTISNMFNGCSNLTEIDLSHFDTSNVGNMGSLFNNCSKLTKVDVSSFNTSNVTDMRYMFNGCNILTDLDLSNFDMGKVNHIGYMFDWCKALTNLNSFKNLGKGYTQKSNNYSNYKLDLSACTLLTYESLIDLITNGLYDLNLTYNVANGGTLYRQSLVLGSTNLAKLTAEEIAIATNKGWNVI